MLTKIRRNDRIVTNGGLIGKVAKVIDDRDELEVDLADNVRVKVRRGMVAEVVSKGDEWSYLELFGKYYNVAVFCF